MNKIGCESQSPWDMQLRPYPFYSISGSINGSKVSTITRVGLNEKKMEEPRTQITVPIDQWFNCEGMALHVKVATCEGYKYHVQAPGSSRLFSIFLSFFIRLLRQSDFPFNLSIYFLLLSMTVFLDPTTLALAICLPICTYGTFPFGRWTLLLLKGNVPYILVNR